MIIYQKLLNHVSCAVFVIICYMVFKNVLTQAICVFDIAGLGEICVGGRPNNTDRSKPLNNIHQGYAKHQRMK